MSREGLTKDRLEILLVLYTLILSSMKKERKWCIKRNKPTPKHPEISTMCEKLIDEILVDDEPDQYKLLKEKTTEICRKLIEFLDNNNDINNEL